MVANMGKCEDILHRRGCGLEGSSLYFSCTYLLDSYNMQGPGWVCVLGGGVLPRSTGYCGAVHPLVSH